MVPLKLFREPQTGFWIAEAIAVELRNICSSLFIVCFILSNLLLQYKSPKAAENIWNSYFCLFLSAINTDSQKVGFNLTCLSKKKSSGVTFKVQLVNWHPLAKILSPNGAPEQFKNLWATIYTWSYNILKKSPNNVQYLQEFNFILITGWIEFFFQFLTLLNAYLLTVIHFPGHISDMIVVH